MSDRLASLRSRSGLASSVFWSLVSGGAGAGPAMYNPRMVREERPAVLHALIRDHPLARLVTMVSRGFRPIGFPSFSWKAGRGAWASSVHISPGDSRPLCWRRSLGDLLRTRGVHNPRAVCVQDGTRQGRAHLELRHGAGTWPSSRN